VCDGGRGTYLQDRIQLIVGTDWILDPINTINRFPSFLVLNVRVGTNPFVLCDVISVVAEFMVRVLLTNPFVLGRNLQCQPIRGVKP
jgi:hypothetical protein